MKTAIVTSNLSRTFKTYQKPEGVWESIKGFWDRKYTEKKALNPCNLEIESGKIVGLVGANGAGKTTLLKLLSGLIYPSSGDAQVLGFRPWERKHDFLRKMSLLLGQKNQLWFDIPAMDSFQLLIQIYDLEPLSARRRIQELAEILDCTHVLKTQLRRLSLGERMKMEIIGSLLHEPEILFLDEPTIGLDIVAQTSIRKFLDHYVKTKGPTVILTSHYMDDIAMLADQLLLISKGTIVYDGSVNDFIKKADLKQKLTFTTSEKLESDFLVEPGMKLLQGEQNFSLQVHSKDLARVLTKITTQKIQDLKIEEADFEEIIRSFMEKESRVF